ncbi:hypothetical protein AGMMS49525_00720 [Bacteroidia bacterium]|nr:hypothetical protein AGMMS49525_00720 [Bacteroidia bacterium]
MKQMKKVLLLAIIAMGLAGHWSQASAQVVIGSSTQAADAGAILDLSKKDAGANTNLGLLLPNVRLSSATVALVSGQANVEGMLVYCPGPNAGQPAALAKGLYVWDGTKWQGVILN